MNKKLMRSDDRVLAGVCGGLAEYFDFDPVLVRVAYAFLTLFTAFSGLLLYIVLWIVMPRRGWAYEKDEHGKVDEQTQRPLTRNAGGCVSQ